jgi:bifunctional DNase/RNase
MSDMVEVVIDSIRVSLMSQQRIVILREAQAERYLPIWIGIYEAEAITLSLQEVEVARPLTWDLLKNVFNTLNARVLRVEVVALREDTFYGNIVVEAEGQVVNIDSRPSDALALAVRANVPILVNSTIMDMAGITPEDDLQDRSIEPSDQPAGSSGVEADSGEENLEIFEDFFEKLDLDDLDKNEGDEEDK